MASSLVSKLRALSLFSSKEGSNENEHKHRSNIIATRIYLVLLTFILTIVSCSLWLTLVRTTITIHYPSKDQFEALPITAECPCSYLSFTYGTFLALQANFHRICSSDFVTDRWVQTLFSNFSESHFYKSDIRATGSAHFQALASLCHLSAKSVLDSLTSFYSTSFVSSKVLYQDYLRSTTEASMKHFQLTAPFVFQSQLQLISDMMFGNQLVPALPTTFSLYNYGDQTSDQMSVSLQHAQYRTTGGSNCSCPSTFNCREALGIYFQDMDDSSNSLSVPLLLLEIPGLWAGCTVTHSLLQSTLECFYNQTCLNTILSHLSTHETFTAMSIDEKSVFRSNSTVQSIVDSMMVEEWTQSVSYENYFAQCRPITCTYTKVERRHLIYIITKIIGLLGGLTMILGVIIPLIVRTVRNRKLSRTQPQISLSVKLQRLIGYCIQCLIQLNLFQDQSQNTSHVHYQRITTRCYMIILIIGFAILALYSSLKTDIYSQNIHKPTESEYNHLTSLYSSSLVCPCSTLAVSHAKFLTIEPLYHQICSSKFISSKWIEILSIFESVSVTGFNYRINAATHFIILATFCHYARKTLNYSLEVFSQTQFVSSQVIDQRIFDYQINSRIEDWKRNTLNSSQRAIQLIRETNQGNKLINDVFNVDYLLDRSTGGIIYQAFTYSNCSCDLFGSCYMPIPSPNTINTYQLWPRFKIPDFFFGCYPVEALLQSKLKCFYNQTCFNKILYDISYLLRYRNLSADFPILDMSDSQFDETMESVINLLMVRSWNSDVSFSSYYNACAPASCTFEYTSRSSVLIIILTVISILGGLSTGLKIFIVLILRLFENLSAIRSCDHLIQLIRNIFMCNNEHKVTDRLHFLLLIITFTILYLVAFLDRHVVAVEISKPSLSDYDNLLEEYSDSVQCSCSEISFQYRTFLTVEPRFHPICSSDFMSDEWIRHVYENDVRFQTTALGQFQLLISICQLSNKTVTDTVSQLTASNSINAQLKSSSLLNEHCQSTSRDFKSSASQSFLSIVNMIREMTAVNMLMNMYSTNWKYQTIDSTAETYLHTKPVVYEECNCGISSKCSQPTTNMRTGCYPLEALLQSTLRCFYDQQCIDSTNTFKALSSSSVSSHFNISSTVEYILQELMLEDYSTNVSYEKYFTQCSPSSCSYSYTGFGDTTSIITSLVGLYGGLSIISRWFALSIVKLHQYRLRRHINPSVQ